MYKMLISGDSVGEFPVWGALTVVLLHMNIRIYYIDRYPLSVAIRSAVIMYIDIYGGRTI